MVDPETLAGEEPFPDDATLAAIERAAIAVIQEAGRLVLTRYGGPLDVQHKGKHATDPVTEVDREVEAFVTRAVTEQFPTHAVLGEEGQEPSGDPEFAWIVDPVDGTLNFINQCPFFAVSLGVLHRRRPVVGALFLPTSGELLHARRGGGAFRNGAPLRVGPATEPSNTLLVGQPSGFWFQFKARRGIRRKLGEPRSLGSIAVELGMVATGAFHYAVFRAPKIWDVAGGIPIVTEAGGVVLRYSQARKGWFPLERFSVPPGKNPDQPRKLRDWRGPVIAGARPVVERVAVGLEPRTAPVALRVAMKRYRRWKDRARTKGQQ